ncbi:MAG: hypothetical protein JW388_0542 [Nitrospira sp.]|nr:hypothetical protein [Nitrospira sp.]
MDDQPLKPKSARLARSDFSPHQRSFERDGAAPTHGIEQDFLRRPTRQSQETGREVFTQGRLDGQDAMAALEEGIAGGVEIKGDGGLIEKGVDTDVRVMGVHVRSLMAHRHELVADGVLNTQGEKVQTGEGAPARTDLHFNGLCGGEPVGPRKAIGRPIDIVFRKIGGVANVPEDAARQVTLEVDPIHRGPRREEGDPTVRLRGQGHTELVELLFEHALQSLRTGCKES